MWDSHAWKTIKFRIRAVGNYAKLGCMYGATREGHVDVYKKGYDGLFFALRRVGSRPAGGTAFWLDATNESPVSANLNRFFFPRALSPTLVMLLARMVTGNLSRRDTMPSGLISFPCGLCN